MLEAGYLVTVGVFEIKYKNYLIILFSLIIYGGLYETDKRNALRMAQLKVKDTCNAHPYFWAAFQTTGSVN